MRQSWFDRAVGRIPPERRASLARMAERLPVYGAVVFAILLLILGKATVERIYGNADVASGPVMGQFYDGGPVTLGFYNWFETVWLEKATKWVPGHRYLWSYGPWILSMISVALVAWTATIATRRRWTGITIFAVLFAACGSLMMWQFAWSGHSLAWVHTCFVGAYVVGCVAGGGWLARSLPLHIVATAVLGVWTGLGYASDKLVLVAAIIPAAITGLLLLRLVPWRIGWRAGASALVVAAIAVLIAPVFRDAATSAGINGLPFNITGADAARRASNLKLLWRSGASLLGGDWSGQANGGRHLLAVLSGLVAAAGLAVGLLYAAFVGVRALRRPTAVRPALAAFVVFWAFSLGVLAAAYVWSTAPIDIASARYLVAGVYGLVALAVVAASDREWTRVVAGVAAGIIVFSGITSLASRDVGNDPYTPTRAMADAITRVGRQFHVKKAYASYWDAAPLSWLTRFEFPVFPTDNCQYAQVCPFNQQRADSWYRPVKGRVMLILDGNTAPGQPPLGAADPKLGKPIYQEQAAGRLAILVYAKDISSGLGPYQP